MNCDISDIDYIDDDNDQIFSEIDLDQIIALESQSTAVVEEVKENRPLSSVLFASDESMTSTSTTSPKRLSPVLNGTKPKKKFNFSKRNNNTSFGENQRATTITTSISVPSSPVVRPTCSKTVVSVPVPSQNYVEADDAFPDDDFFSSHMDVILELERSAEKENTKSPAQKKETKTLPYLFPACVGSEAADKKWRKYCETFANEGAFQTPWFQSIPLTGLNATACRALANGLKNPHELVQFGIKYLLPFLKELNSPSEANTVDASINESYYKDLALSLERVLLRYEDEYLDQDSLSTTLEKSDFHELVESVVISYFNGEVDFSMTSIPDVLLRLHQPTLEMILSSALDTGNVSLIIPICSTSQNVSKIFKTLHSRIADNDNEDFQCTTDIIRKLFDSLQAKLGTLNLINVLPHDLQALYIIEVSLGAFQGSFSVRNRAVVQQILPWLNKLFRDGNENFAQFILTTILPHINALLKDKQLTWTTVNYRTYPNLWRFLRRKSWLTD